MWNVGKPMTVENSQKTVFYSHWRKKKINVENKCFSLLEAVKYNQAMTDEMLAAGDEQLIF